MNMNDEMDNIIQIKEYIDSRQHQSTGAYNVWQAEVIYESKLYGSKVYNNADVLYQYSGDAQIIINAIMPPYYSNFNPKFQSFEFVNNCLVIKGTGSNGDEYKVTII